MLSATDRSVSFYQNSSVWLDRLDSRSWDRNPVESNASPRFYHSAAADHGEKLKESKNKDNYQDLARY